jgi:cell division transport system permease protein
MPRAISRYFELHLQNFVGAAGRLARQPLASLLTILVIAIALALPGGLRVLVSNATALSDSWQGAADFTVYLAMDVDAARAAALAREIEARDDVGAVELISRDAALEEFRAQSGFGEALEALEGNPLPHTLVVRPASGISGDVETLAKQLDALPETELVQLDTAWVARLRAMLRLVTRLVDVASILLGIAVAIVVGNTIRLEIQNRAVEIEVTKLVGGTDAFIRRPFLYLGLCYGLGGALVATALVTVTLALVGPPVRNLAELYGSSFRLAGLSLRDAGTLLAGGAFLGWAGAGLATARHLRAIEPK